jgi:cytochrome c2
MAHARKLKKRRARCPECHKVVQVVRQTRELAPHVPGWDERDRKCGESEADYYQRAHSRKEQRFVWTRDSSGVRWL